MSNADIQRDFERSGLSRVDEFLTLIVLCWRKHRELEFPGGIQETLDHQVRRLIEEWESYHDLPDVYHNMSHEVLQEILQGQAAVAA